MKKVVLSFIIFFFFAVPFGFTQDQVGTNDVVTSYPRQPFVVTVNSEGCLPTNGYLCKDKKDASISCTGLHFPSKRFKNLEDAKAFARKMENKVYKNVDCNCYLAKKSDDPSINDLEVASEFKTDVKCRPTLLEISTTTHNISF